MTLVSTYESYYFGGHNQAKFTRSILQRFGIFGPDNGAMTIWTKFATGNDFFGPDLRRGDDFLDQICDGCGSGGF